jgi:hypothetical protein
LPAGRFYAIGKSQTPPCHAAHDRTDGNAQYFGYFLVGKAVNADQREDGPLFLRQVT